VFVISPKMDVEASDTPKICGGGDDVKKEPVSCQDFNSSLRTFSSKCDTDALLVKRLFDDSNSLDVSVKKSKASTYDDQGKDGDGILSSSTARKPRKSADERTSIGTKLV